MCVYVYYHTAEIFLLDISFAQPSYPCIIEIFSGINFTHVVRVTIGSI